MADEPLRLRATVDDKASAPLRNIQKALADIGRQNMGGLRGEFSGLESRLRPVKDLLNGISTHLGFVTLAGGGAASALIATAKALDTFSRNTLQMRDFARMTGFATREVAQFQEAFKHLDIAPDQAQQGIATFSKNLFELRNRIGQLRDFLAKGGATALSQELERLARAGQYGEALKVAADAIERISRSDPEKAALLAEALFGDRQFQKLERFNGAMAETGKIVDRNVEEAEKFHKQMLRWDSALDRLKIKMGNALLDPMTQAIEKLNLIINKVENGPASGLIEVPRQELNRQLRDSLSGRRKELSDFDAKGGGNLYARQKLLDDIDRLERALKQGAEKGVEEGLKKMSFMPGSGGGGGPIVVPASFGGSSGAAAAGFRKLGGPRGSGIYVPGGDALGLPGSRGSRNNNPGNLKFGPFAQSLGATGADEKGFAIFPDRATGEAAMSSLLQKNYNGMTIGQMGQKYAEGDPTWARNVEKFSGLGSGPVDTSNPDARRRLMDAIQRQEGTSLGKAGNSLGGGGGGPLGPSQALAIARANLGANEIADRSKLAGFFAANGYNVDPATTSWCATYVGSSLRAAGIEPVTGPGKNVANSYLRWGKGVSPEDVKGGDVLVQHRGRGFGNTGGHVGFATGNTKFDQRGRLMLEMLSGNDSNSVRNSWRYASGLAVRRSLDAGLMDDALRAQTSPNLTGSASIKVDVNAPKGTRVTADAQGLFRDVETRRTTQMPSPNDGPLQDWSSP